MQHTIEHQRDATGGARVGPDEHGRRRAGPVMLATFDSAPFHADAVRVAVDSAVECGRPLVVVNAVEFAPGGRLVRIDAPLDPPAVADALRAPAELAHALGLRVERLRLLSPRVPRALLALVSERRPALVVFGPDPRALRRLRRPTRRRARRLLAALAREPDATGLLWSVQRFGAGAVSSSARPVPRPRLPPVRRAGPGSRTRIGRLARSHVPTTNGTRP
jgi:nucleotide-binding universal stress UspA family protein